ncbi:MAG: UbiA prenyltransferase family protein [Bacteroidales bacterium]|nr:UbiA prenyltransferase family protein [Bacteroidales bacterium]
MIIINKIYLLFRLLRANQYVKNCFVFFPLFFGGEIFNKELLLKELLLFAAFCLASSFVYILNDIKDQENDRNHPIKKLRPIASGEVSTTTAFFVGELCLMLSFIVIYYIKSIIILICVIIYVILNIIYTYFTKKIVIADVVSVALGFVLRVLAGSLLTPKAVSQWLVIMVFLLSIFLALGKRWHDVVLTEEDSTTGKIRKSLENYTKEWLQSLLTFFASINTICYIIYTITTDTHDEFYNKYFYSSSIWVIIGNMRYLQIIFVDKSSYSPTQALIYDKMIRYTVLLWVIHTSLFLYLKL